MTTKEAPYAAYLEEINERGFERLGMLTSPIWHQDPKHLLFRLARYKFVAKMLSGKSKVLEVGCGDGFGLRIVQAEVERVTAIDFDPIFINDIKERMVPEWQFEAYVHNPLEAPVQGAFDAIFSVDVLEHIDPKDEALFLRNSFSPLAENGVAIIGMPSLESQVHASPMSRATHVNCKTGPDLKATMERYFHNVFMFSMNDEVIHTGYQKMAHYIWALCAGKKSSGI